MSERRKGEGRIPLRARVWCEDEEVTLYVPAVDVSDDGLCVRTARPFPEGHELRLGLSGPEGEAVATARVAWSKPSRETPAMGLSLVEFEVGREVFEQMVERARREERGLRSTLPMPEPVVERTPETTPEATQAISSSPGLSDDSTP